MFRQWLATLLGFVVLLVIGCVVWLVDRSEVAHWTGASDLLIEFVVSDADSGQPIPDARINIDSDEGRYTGDDEERKTPFLLRTNADGTASRLLYNNPCTGRQSRLGLIDTRIAHMPSWKLQVLAEGYGASESVHLASHWGKAQRDGPSRDRLVMRINLEKKNRG